MQKIVKNSLFIMLLLISFAVAINNIHNVKIYFDPLGLFTIIGFENNYFELPLSAFTILAVFVGSVIGGLFTWWSQRKYRQKARSAQWELDQLKNKIKCNIK